MSLIHGLYAIIDPRFTGQRAPLALARAFLSGGCRLLQLRVKGPGEDSTVNSRRYECAREILALKREYDFCCIINDDAALARELRADGVHVGKEDMSIADARALLGPNTLIGYSAHSLAEAQAAQQAGASYVAFGAIFPTVTKGADHPVQGLTHLSEVVRALSVPVVAVGGINRNTVGPVWDSGVAAVAMITALSLAPDPLAEARWVVQRLQRRITNYQIPNTKQ